MTRLNGPDLVRVFKFQTETLLANFILNQQFFGPTKVAL